jgi:hypothetical protein
LENQYHPAVAAAHDTNSVLVVYSIDLPIGTALDAAYSVDGGSTWTKNDPVTGGEDEGYADLVVTQNADAQGWFHLTFHGTIDGWHGIWYRRSAISDPTGDLPHTLIRADVDGTVSSQYPRPAIAVDPTKSGKTEACIAWTDTRATTNDIYFAREWHIFSDGFESGNTSTWSATVGGP